MEWLKLSTSTELVQIATDKNVNVCADSNYSDLVLTGMRDVDFCITFCLRMADVSMRVGFGFTNNLDLIYKCKYGVALMSFERKTKGSRRKKQTVL